jgi:hypothetical protein
MTRRTRTQPGELPTIRSLLIFKQGGEIVRHGPAKLCVQINQVRVHQAHLLTQCRYLGSNLITPGGLDPAQLGAKLLYLLGQIIDTGRPFGDVFRCGTDENALAGPTDHQPVAAKLSDRGPDHRAGDAIYIGQLRGGRDGRADRELPRGDLLPKVVCDLLVSGAPDGFGHLAVLPELPWPCHHICAPHQVVRHAPTLAEGRHALNRTYYVEHSVLACYGRLWTATDAEIASVIAPAFATDSPLYWFRKPPIPDKHPASTTSIDQGSPGEHAAKHSRRGRTPYQEAPPS